MCVCALDAAISDIDISFSFANKSATSIKNNCEAAREWVNKGCGIDKVNKKLCVCCQHGGDDDDDDVVTIGFLNHHVKL